MAAKHRKEGPTVIGLRTGIMGHPGPGRHIDPSKRIDGPSAKRPRPRISAHGAALDEGVL